MDDYVTLRAAGRDIAVPVWAETSGIFQCTSVEETIAIYDANAIFYSAAVEHALTQVSFGAYDPNGTILLLLRPYDFGYTEEYVLLDDWLEVVNSAHLKDVIHNVAFKVPIMIEEEDAVSQIVVGTRPIDGKFLVISACPRDKRVFLDMKTGTVVDGKVCINPRTKWLFKK